MDRKPPSAGAGTETRRRRAEPATEFLGTQVLPSVLGTDAPVTGKLSFTAPTRIDGILRGEVRATSLLVIGESGSVEGTVRAAQLVVLGEVRGDVKGAERVEIGPRGRIIGSVETRRVVIKEGGLLDGECRMPLARATPRTGE